MACGPKAQAPVPPDQNRGVPDVVLAVTVIGDGAVHATGLDCRGACTQRFPKGTRLSLRPAPDSGATFAGWSGACSGQACDLTLDADAAVTARFDRPPPPPALHRLTVASEGHGAVRSSPAAIDCGAACAADFNAGTQVTLSAAPDAGYAFTAWSGACTGTGACTVAMNADARVSARFDALPPQEVTITLSVSGPGHVSGNGLDCPGTCSTHVAVGTTLSLVAAANAGARLIAWGGPCTPAGTTCSLNVTQGAALSASFESEVVQLAPADGTNYNDLAINSTQVFYWRYGSNIYGLWSVPKAGGTPTIVTTGDCCFNGLVADDTFVYWTNYYTGIFRAPVGGGAAQKIYTGNNIRGLALDGQGQIFWSTQTTYQGSGGVFTGSTSGGVATALAYANPSGGIAVDSRYAYWTDLNIIYRVPRTGGTAEALLQCDTCRPQAIKVDFENFYYRNLDGDTWSRAIAGGELHKLSSGNPRDNTVYQPIELDVHSKVAYWTWHDGSGSGLQGLFSSNADGTGWTAIEKSSDRYWYGPRVDDHFIFYFHAGALYRRLK